MSEGLFFALMAVLLLCFLSLSHPLPGAARQDVRVGAEAASEPAISAVISRVQGKVEVCLWKEKVWRVVGPGFPLGPSDKVRTGRNSWAEIQITCESIPGVASGSGPGSQVLRSWVRLGPETQFQIEGISAAMVPGDFKVRGDAGVESQAIQEDNIKSPIDGGGKASFWPRVALKTRLSFGRVYIKVLRLFGIDQDMSPGFEVVTDVATIGVRGTLFSARVLPSMATGVSVREGLVEVTAMGKSVTVGAGQETMVHPGMPPQPPAGMSPNEERMWKGVMGWLDGVKDEIGNIRTNAGGNGMTGENYGNGKSPEGDHVRDRGENHGKSK